MLGGQPFADQPDPGCTDFASEGSNCDWLVDPGTFDPDACEPYASFPADVSAGELMAGPAALTLPFDLGLGVIELPLSGATLKGSLAGGTANITDGRLCGEFSKADLIDALNTACASPDAPPLCNTLGLLTGFLTCDPCTLVVGFEGAETNSLTLDL